MTSTFKAASVEESVEECDSNAGSQVDESKPKLDVFGLLIDIYRLRMEDNYTFDGHVAVDSIYSGNPHIDGTQGFRKLIRKVDREKRRLLPDWWCDARREECIQYGTRGGWYRLDVAIEKSDIIEHYGDSQLPMQLRIFAELVLGRGPGGADGIAMMKWMMEAEQEGGMLSVLSLV